MSEMNRLEIELEDYNEKHPMLTLTANEVKALYRIIEHEWISRDDNEAMAVADKIGKFVRDLRKEN